VLAIINSRIPELQLELEKFSVIGWGGDKQEQKAVRPEGHRKYRRKYYLEQYPKMRELVEAQLKEWKRLGLPYGQIKYFGPPGLVQGMVDRLGLEGIRRAEEPNSNSIPESSNRSQLREEENRKPPVEMCQDDVGGSFGEQKPAEAQRLALPPEEAIYAPVRVKSECDHMEKVLRREQRILEEHGKDSEEWRNYLRENPSGA